MDLNKQLNALLLYYEKERNLSRAEELEKRIIPHQQRLIDESKRLGLYTVADLRILQGMKREFKYLTGREYD